MGKYHDVELDSCLWAWIISPSVDNSHDVKKLSWAWFNLILLGVPNSSRTFDLAQINHSKKCVSSLVSSEFDKFPLKSSIVILDLRWHGAPAHALRSFTLAGGNRKLTGRISGRGSQRDYVWWARSSMFASRGCRKQHVHLRAGIYVDGQRLHVVCSRELQGGGRRARLHVVSRIPHHISKRHGGRRLPVYARIRAWRGSAGVLALQSRGLQGLQGR